MRKVWIALSIFGVVCVSVAAGQRLLVVNQVDATVSVLDPATRTRVSTIAEDTGPVWGHEISVSPDGKTAYVPVYGSAGVGKPGIDGHELLIIDVASHAVTGRVEFGHGGRPHCMVFDPTTGLYYVTTEIDHTVSIYDAKAGKIVGAIPTGAAESHMLAVSHDGRFGYTANVGSGTVSVLDLRGRKLVGVVKVAPTVQRIAVSNDDRYVFTSDYTSPELVVLDAAKQTVARRIPLPDRGYGAAATRDGKYLILAIPAKNQIAVVDLDKMTVVRTLDVEATPQEVLIRPDGKEAYVSCVQAGKVSVVNLVAWKVTATIDAGKYADGLGWAE